MLILQYAYSERRIQNVRIAPKKTETVTSACVYKTAIRPYLFIKAHTFFSHLSTYIL